MMDETEVQHRITPKAERALSYILLAGAITSSVLFAVGLVSSLVGSSISDASETMSLSSIFNSIASMDSMGLISLGVLTLIATPLVRIIATILYFSQIDRRLAALPVITLVMIVVGFILRM